MDTLREGGRVTDGYIEREREGEGGRGNEIEIENERENVTEATSMRGEERRESERGEREAMREREGVGSD